MCVEGLPRLHRHRMRRRGRTLRAGALGEQLDNRAMSEWWRRFLYGWAYSTPAYITTRLVTGLAPLAFLAGIITFKLAIDDWDASHKLGKR